jgi:hypothetical protein
MKSKSESGDLYVLLDGTHAAPGDCEAGDDGVMRHLNGVPVALTDAGEPMTVRRQVEMGGNALAAEMGKVDAAGPAMPEGASAGDVPQVTSTPAPAPKPAKE